MTEEYTKDDDAYGAEYREIRKHQRLINEELAQYSWTTIRKFEEIFPCQYPIATLEVFCKEYVEEQNNIRISMELHEQNNQPWKHVTEHYFTEYIQWASVADFWERWNKFKKLKVFL